VARPRVHRIINEGNGGLDVPRHSSTLRGAEVISAVSFLCRPPRRAPFLPRIGSCRRAIVTLSSLPHQRYPSPSVIGNPINRNLSNPPTQTTSISLETAPPTTNHAFTQTALIPRGLFFKIVTSLLFGRPTDRACSHGIFGH